MNRVGAVPSQPAAAMESFIRIPVKCEQRIAGKKLRSLIKLKRQAKTIRFFFFFIPDRSFSKHVFEVPMSYCVSLERTSGGQTNACPLDCKNEPEMPTCGSDGSIYRNECEMQMLNCGLVMANFN